MKKNFTMFIGIMIAGVIAFGAMAQNNTSYRHNDQSRTKTIEKNLNMDFSKSINEVIFYDDFSSGMDNWTVVGEGLDNWSVSNSDNAGGVAPELYMGYSPLFNGTSRVVSPIVDTDGFSSLNLTFNHLLDLWSGGGGFWVSVETTSDGGTTWNQVWEIYYEATDDYLASESITIDNGDMGSESFQFCFKFEDNSDLLDAWAIDDVTLGETSEVDAQPLSIGGLDGLLYLGEDVNVTSDVRNNGVASATFDVVLEVDNGTDVVFSSTQTVTDLANGATTTVNFETWIPDVASGYTATVTTLLTGDENPNNDAMTKVFGILDPDSYCIPGGDCSYGDGINDFEFAGIVNNGSGCSDLGYGIFTNLQASVEIGSTYTCTLSTQYSSQFVSIWVDFNLDNIFQSSELILTDYFLETAGLSYEVDIEIPGYGQANITTMRVGANFNEPSSPDPCATFLYGEWEDYSIEVTGESIQFDASVVSIDLENTYGQGEIIPMATVKNSGIQTISFPVTCTIGGYSETIQVTDLESAATLQIEFPAWNATTGQYTIEVSTALENDENPDNDMMSDVVTIVEVAPEKRVVGEEGTGTWCGWCVRGIVYMEYLHETYPDTWIGIAVHNGDVMTDAEYDDALGINSFPGGYVSRKIMADPSGFEDAFLDEMEIIAPAFINVGNRVFNAETREISFDVSCEFVGDTENYLLSGILVENGVTGPAPDYNQANSYSGGASGEMGGFEDLPNPVPAADMVYNDVARGIIGGFDGAEGSLPTTIIGGEVYTYTFTATVDEDWDENNMEVIGLLINQEDGTIVNAAKEHMIVSVEELAGDEVLHVYPNPATNELHILNSSNGHVYIYNMRGQLVMEESHMDNNYRLDISNFENGTYIIKVINETETFTTKVNVIK